MPTIRSFWLNKDNYLINNDLSINKETFDLNKLIQSASQKATDSKS